jgi:hypothetical protein
VSGFILLVKINRPLGWIGSPLESQDSIFDPANNIQASSIQRVRGAGHMVWFLTPLQPNID